ncbi:MAG TPA: bifunctional [glutamine synthetase] adenylyltransferase/[glutamine synthetase]-adenylyl-L-tyrosine phosphorylase [Rhizomicrobium sp.]|jgi:glutamate-ammonia-ligase adenylyltransferase|nr:bifunctional [glutamine synthetase] adenylyltransferase/[glutamine synthetase]-adenylyl-L-tyrosine phosphorylase [Rhizomicrobium sp.]
MKAFGSANEQLPLPFDGARVERTFDQLAAEEFLSAPEDVALLRSTFGNSPFLSRLAVRDSGFLAVLLASGVEAALSGVSARVAAGAHVENISEAMRVLRESKRHAALAIALADISGAWSLEQVTAALSAFADACVGSAVRFLLRETAAKTELASLAPDELEAETGLIVLALGKYGAGELNYSSDIDLVVFYDADRFPFRKRDNARAAAVDLAKGLLKLLSETTVDGYVFRVDLRLRPDAAATQIAISTDAAEAYYEGMGQNWERAALIKVRTCAGDREAAAQFLRNIEPFVWRRNLDFAAIEDIHSIKRQIHAHSGHEKIAVAGHNIKLGRGGIREIEFFVQTQQLILGGRDPGLRASSTIAALGALRERGLVAAEAAEELRTAYRFLRTLEHRLQMIEDEQTHTIPQTPEGLAHIATFMGFDSVAAFSAAVTQHLEAVQRHYASLFERAPPLDSAKGSLVFTGVEDDPETLRTLSGLGFSDVHHVAAAIRGWHHGRVRASRGARARELLTKLVPPLLQALAHTVDPDSAFTQFDLFLSRVPAGVQLFSLLLANPRLLKLIASICGAAPRFADHLARSPKVLDALLAPDAVRDAPGAAQLAHALAEQIAAEPDYEGKLDAVRRFTAEQDFRIAVRLLEGAISGENAGHAFSNIAETIIRQLLPAVEHEFAKTFGPVAGGEFAVVAMGKLGGREMTAISDLDLVFIYDAPPDVEHSDGAKPLPIAAYYTRLAQRLIAALTVHTAEGGLYEVDMRLRPTGNKGPVAVRLEGFERYHQNDAWTWERMALTRARVVSSPSALRQRVDTAIRAALRAQADPEKLKTDVREMREKVNEQRPPKTQWDLKYARGGLVDIEFGAQYLQLREAHRRADVLEVGTAAALGHLRSANALSADQAATFIGALQLQQNLLQVLRIAVGETFDPSRASPGLKQLLARAANRAGFESLEQHLFAMQSSARAIYDALLG